MLKKLHFSSFGRTNQWNKDPILCRNYLVHCLGEGKMYPAALHKVPTQTVGSSQVFERWILQKHPRMINKMTKCWDRNTISDLEQVCPKQAQDFLSWLLSSKTTLPRLMLSSRSVICFVSSVFQNECYKKIMSSWKNYFSSKDKYNKQVQNLQMLHSPGSIHLCFPLGTMKPCFVSERVTRADPWTVRFDEILNFRATIVIQFFYIPSKKIGQQSTLLESLSEHFCIHYFYVIKNSKQLLII